MRKLVLAAVALAMVAAACTSNSEPTGQSSPDAPTTVVPPPAPSPTKPKPLSLAQANMSGLYDIHVFTTQDSFGGSSGTKVQHFHAKALCSVGVCDTKLSGTMAYPGPSKYNDKFSVHLVHVGRRFQGVVEGPFATCGSKPAKDRWKFDISTVKAAYPTKAHGWGPWTVVKFTGTWTRSASFGGVCLPATYRAIIRGILDH